MRSQTEGLLTEAEALARRIDAVSDEEIGAFAERENVLEDALSALEAGMQDLPERDCLAIRSLFCEQLIQLVFVFNLPLQTSMHREKIRSTETHIEKAIAVAEFQKCVKGLALVCGLK